MKPWDGSPTHAHPSGNGIQIGFFLLSMFLMAKSNLYLSHSPNLICYELYRYQSFHCQFKKLGLY